MRGFEPTLKIQPLGENDNTYTQGRLIYDEDQKKTYLQDRYGKQYAWERLLFMTDRWNDVEGTKSYPKPYRYKDNALIEDGDELIFSKFSRDLFLIWGAVKTVIYKHDEPSLVQETGNFDETVKVRDNEHRYFETKETEDGNHSYYLEGKQSGKGNYGVIIRGKDGDGNYRIKADGEIRLTKIDKDGNKVATVGMTDDGKISLASNGIDLLEQISNILDEITKLKVLGNLGSPTTQPLNSQAFLSIKEKIDSIRQ